MSTTKIIIVVAAFLVVVSIFLGYTYGAKNPNKDLLEQLLKAKIDVIETEKESQLAILQNTITDLEAKLKSSQTQYLTAKKRIVSLQKSIESVKPPENISEVKERFKVLGYEPK